MYISDLCLQSSNEEIRDQIEEKQLLSLGLQGHFPAIEPRIVRKCRSCLDNKVYEN